MALRTFVEVEPSGRVKHQVRADVEPHRVPAAWIEVTDPALAQQDLMDWTYAQGQFTTPAAVKGTP